MKSIKWLLLMIGTIALCGCLGGSDGDTGGVSSQQLPIVYIVCSQHQSLDCQSSNAGKTFYVGLISDLETNCENYLAQIQSGQFALFFDASGKSTTTFRGDMEGEIDTWEGDQGNPIRNISSVAHKACAYIDNNGNGQLDAIETVGELVIQPENDLPIITDWF